MIGFAVEIIYRLCLALVLAQQQAKMSEKIVLSFVHTTLPYPISTKYLHSASAYLSTIATSAAPLLK